jgi:hypothetical protein
LEVELVMQTVHQIVMRTFNGRHGRDGSKSIHYRQMGREELAALLAEIRDAERKRCAVIAMGHEDDDERTARQLAHMIFDEIMGLY